jgi:hypothetical protein
VLETTSCRNVGKDCVCKTQSGRTLRKRKLCAPGCPFFYYLVCPLHICILLAYYCMCCTHTHTSYLITIYLFVLPGIMLNLQLSCVIVGYTSIFVAELGWLVRVLLILDIYVCSSFIALPPPPPPFHLVFIFVFQPLWDSCLAYPTCLGLRLGCCCCTLKLNYMFT